LHIQHDNPPSGVFTQIFDLHPEEPRNIDLFSTADSTANSVAHFALSVSGVDLRVPITNRCRFRVMVNAQNVPVLFKWFILWMDEGGYFNAQWNERISNTIVRVSEHFDAVQDANVPHVPRHGLSGGVSESCGCAQNQRQRD
jgi:hypothetical protein